MAPIDRTKTPDLPTVPNVEEIDAVARGFFQASKPQADILAALEAEMDSDDFRGAAPAWKPEPDEFVAGTILSIWEATGEYGSSPAMTLSQRDGTEVTVYCSATVLRNQFERAKPSVGDTVGIKYLGEVENPKSKRTYKNYQMKVVRS